MEDVMETGTFRQSKAIGHQSNALLHLEGAGVAWPELAHGLGLKRSRWLVKKTEPHPVTHRKLQLAMVVVIVALGILLRLVETLAHLS